jgi:hypothetical protein
MNGRVGKFDLKLFVLSEKCVNRIEHD